MSRSRCATTISLIAGTEQRSSVPTLLTYPMKDYSPISKIVLRAAASCSASTPTVRTDRGFPMFRDRASAVDWLQSIEPSA